VTGEPAQDQCQEVEGCMLDRACPDYRKRCLKAEDALTAGEHA
jgi:hypothetical protein